MLFAWSATYIVISGISGIICRLYIASFSRAVDTVDHASTARRIFWRYQVFSACLLGSFFVSPVFLYFVDWGSLRGTPVAQVLYVLCLMPIAIVSFVLEIRRMRRVSRKKSRARQESRRHL
ncbi:hypothetical protein DWG18_13890 [Lysobacter sp. TY2-98]|nr:hypothetical protein DWG18_13890 [Lysobacter sp. TY2-98]